MQVQPYLFFDGCCEAAGHFYAQAIDAEVTVMTRYRDMPEPRPPGLVPPGAADKVMHMAMKLGDSVIMAADDCTGRPNFSGFSLSLTAKSEAEAEAYFAALSDLGEVRMPLAPTFFAARFGMLIDRFGVGWMVTVGKA
jgi:PhnB protein